MSKGRGKIDVADGKNTQFSSTYQPFKRGRRPIVFSEIALAFKASGIERATDAIVIEAFEYLLSLPLAEVIEIAGSPVVENDLPSMYRLVAKEMIGKNGQRMIEQMLDRAHGKAKQSTDITSGGERIGGPFDGLDTDSKAEVLRILLKK